MKFYLEDKETVLSKLKAPQDGLSKSEAQQRLEANGKNKLAEAKKTSLLMPSVIEGYENSSIFFAIRRMCK